jgi:hypothetical protein
MHWLGVSENNFSNLALLIVITNLSALLPLPFLGWLPKADESSKPAAESSHTRTVEANATSRHLGQPFLPDLMTEFIPQPRQPEPAVEE